MLTEFLGIYWAGYWAQCLLNVARNGPNFWLTNMSLNILFATSRSICRSKFLVQTGDEMSKRSKFVFCTWVGPNVSVMKKAKMSTDKALLKDIITNLSVELLVESAGEFTLEHFKTEVDKAGGAR